MPGNLKLKTLTVQSDAELLRWQDHDVGVDDWKFNFFVVLASRVCKKEGLWVKEKKLISF